MNREPSTQKIFLTKPTGTRTSGRSNLRWVDCPERDFATQRVFNWKTMAKKEREIHGRKFLRKPKPTQSCRAIKKRDNQ
ncbi:hypothetical protein TNCV_3096841 [Trichonephila clavipes]|uniref:Uncharacterized protein n=1 Tax=Trichonephila clavipes TaxID=2585209 RepID=A0A8X6SIQ4_TRICX|nr:hypothetical protein TNCV_3096841 [Trichonephila clavipes]